MGWRTTVLLPLLMLGLAVPVVLAGAEPACACSCVPRSDAEAFRDAGAVFVGEVVSRRRDDGLFASSTDPVTYVFAVSAVHKGRVHERQEVVSASSGASCGLEIEVGKRYLVFTDPTSSEPDPSPGSGQLSANLCGGTRPADSDAVAEAFGPAGSPLPGTAGTSSRGIAGRTLAAWPYLLGGALALTLAALGGWWWLQARRAAGAPDGHGS